jgi:hypothetical protein
MSDRERGWKIGGGAVGGTLLGGVAGAVLGIAVGGGLGKAALSHPENLPKPQNKSDWMAAGAKAVDGCMGVFGMLIGALVGGVVGTLGGSVAGAMFGAGAAAAATGDQAPDATEAPAPGMPRPGPYDAGEGHSPPHGPRAVSGGAEGAGAGRAGEDADRRLETAERPRVTTAQPAPDQQSPGRPGR